MTRLTEKVGVEFFFFKWQLEDDSLINLGNLFHSFGPAREKLVTLIYMMSYDWTLLISKGIK